MHGLIWARSDRATEAATKTGAAAQANAFCRAIFVGCNTAGWVSLTRTKGHEAFAPAGAWKEHLRKGTIAARLSDAPQRLRDTPVSMPQDKVDVATRVVEAYNRRDVDGLFAELATPDFEWYPAIVRALDGGGYRGREGVERFAADTDESWEELQIVAEEFRDLGEQVLLLGRLKGRGKGSGAPVDQRFACVLDFRGDRVWRSRVYLDRSEGLRAAGLSGRELERRSDTPGLRLP